MTSAFILAVTHTLSCGVLAALLALCILRAGAGAEHLHARRVFFACLAAGLALALVLALLRRATAINRGMVNTVILLVTVTVTVVFLVSLWLPTAKGHRVREMVTLFGMWTGCTLCGLLVLFSAQNIFLMPADFVLPGESAFSTDVLAQSAGLLLGIALTVTAAAALYRGARKMPRPLAAGALSAALLAEGVLQTAQILQFLSARRVIRPGPLLFRFFSTLLNHSIYVNYLMIGIGVLVIFASFLVKKSDFFAFRNPAELRKYKASRAADLRRRVLAAASLAFALFSLTALKAWHEKEVTLSPAEPMEIAGNEIRIPVTRIEDGHLHRFAWNAPDGTELRFIVIKKSAAAYGVGLDACDICGDTGYYERSDGVVCRLCDVVMNKATIGFKGGCNPVPLEYRMRNAFMIINLADLEKEKGRFK
ncbi:MAG: Fe-S-containing protein [Treponema sp.]|jgi:uncharacterized membrane protein|nr:Fe-S-containing protein [Treponema sp.]